MNSSNRGRRSSGERPSPSERARAGTLVLSEPKSSVENSPPRVLRRLAARSESSPTRSRFDRYPPDESLVRARLDRGVLRKADRRAAVPRLLSRGRPRSRARSGGTVAGTTRLETGLRLSNPLEAGIQFRTDRRLHLDGSSAPRAASVEHFRFALPPDQLLPRQLQIGIGEEKSAIRRSLTGMSIRRSFQRPRWVRCRLGGPVGTANEDVIAFDAHDNGPHLG